MRRCAGAAQVVQEVFCWSRNPMEVRRLCGCKEELYSKLIGNHHPPVVPGVPLFLDTLVKHNVRARPSLLPCTMCCTPFRVAMLLHRHSPPWCVMLSNSLLLPWMLR